MPASLSPSDPLSRNTGSPKKIVPRLCGCCGKAIDSIILVFTQSHISGFNSGMARPGVLGGQEPPKNSLSPPSAFEFLKIFVHCRHSRNLLVMLLESVVAF